MSALSNQDPCKKKITKKITSMDVIIGQKIKKLRTLCGHSQVNIAKAIGITFQQFQKYECGINRICITRLLDICRYCNFDPSRFFAEIYSDSPSESPYSGPTNLSSLSDSGSKTNERFEYENVDNKEILMLIRLFTSIKDQAVRKKAVSLIKVLANESIEENA